MICITVPLFVGHYLVSPPKHNFHCKSGAARLFVQQIFPVNENQIQTLHHWLELALFPWQPTLHVKNSLAATKLFVKELVQANTKEKINDLYHCSFVHLSFSELGCGLGFSYKQHDRGEWSSHITGASVPDLWVMAGMLTSWQLWGHHITPTFHAWGISYTTQVLDVYSIYKMTGSSTLHSRGCAKATSLQAGFSLPWDTGRWRLTWCMLALPHLTSWKCPTQF